LQVQSLGLPVLTANKAAALRFTRSPILARPKPKSDSPNASRHPFVIPAIPFVIPAQAGIIPFVIPAKAGIQRATSAFRPSPFANPPPRA